jgi:chorismate-pyruvate lyase
MPSRFQLTWVSGCGLLLFAALAHGDDGSATWPDSFVARLEALALLQTLNAELLSHDSATAALEQWCAAHHLANPARITAERLPGADQPPTAEQRQELRVTPMQAVRYRHVKLHCGTVVLSEAENWYVPSRLTAAMNQQLNTTDAPFGKVTQALHFQRHTIAARLLWHPLPEGWELQSVATQASAGALSPPAQVLEHRALLVLPDGIPISEVIETYTGNVLAFSPAPP